MTRFLCLPLLLVFVLPAFTQDEPPEPGQSFPRDSAFLVRKREELSGELRQIQQMLGVVTDAQLTETLKTQQAELTQQLLGIMQEMQIGGKAPNTRAPELPLPPGQPMQGMPSAPQISEPVVLPMVPERRVYPQNVPGMSRDDYYQRNAPMPTRPPEMPVPPMPGYPGMGAGWGTPPLGDADRMWDATPWGPRLPKELVETKQSVESLRKEIADLKETIKALETQIQLLTRNILLERMKENGN